MTTRNNITRLKANRNNLRKTMTSAEVALWLMIKGKQLGERFLRQYSIENFIVDFYCPKFRLAIELDGEDHFTEDGLARDEKRDKYLRTLGISVLRFENFEVFDYPQRTLDEIKRYLCEVPPVVNIPLR